jgi:hypothetical protein
MKKRIVGLLAGVAMVALAAPNAEAVFITGGLTVADGITAASLPAPGNSEIVSMATSIDHELALTSGGSGDFAGLGGLNPAMTDFAFGSPILVNPLFTAGGFNFVITSAVVAATNNFGCNAGQGTCNDGLTLDLMGYVTAAGFDQTGLTGSLSLSGSCVGNITDGCLSDINGGYTYSLAATGREVPSPEPASLLLFGAGLIGLATRLRKSR